MQERALLNRIGSFGIGAFGLLGMIGVVQADGEKVA
jgi:hypothetical protein